MTPEELHSAAPKYRSNGAPDENLLRAIKTVAESGLNRLFQSCGAIICFGGHRYTSHNVSETSLDARVVADELARQRGFTREGGVVRLHQLLEMGALSVPLPAVVIIRDPLSPQGYATITVEHQGREQ